MGGADKIFAPLAGRPLICYPLALFEGCAEVGAVVAVVAPACRERVLRLVADSGFRKVREVVPGGARRQDSAVAGLGAAARCGSGRAAVLIHDAARPLATEDLIRRVLVALADADGAVPGVAVTDTIKRVEEGGSVVATLARDHLRAVQTPQAFGLGAISAAYERASREGWEATDDAAVLERAGGRVVVVAGDPDNVKVTYPRDLARAESLLRAGEEEP